MDERPAMNTSAQDKPKVLLTPEETAEALGCGRSQVYALISEGHLRSVDRLTAFVAARARVSKAPSVANPQESPLAPQTVAAEDADLGPYLERVRRDAGLRS